MAVDYGLLDSSDVAPSHRNLKVTAYVVGALTVGVVLGAMASNPLAPAVASGTATALAASASPLTNAKLAVPRATIFASPVVKVGNDEGLPRSVAAQAVSKSALNAVSKSALNAVQAPERVREVEHASKEEQQKELRRIWELEDPLIKEDTLIKMENDELQNGQAVLALRRFSDALEGLPQVGWENRLRPAFSEMALNLETFNPVFTSCLFQVQMTAGISDYERRDQCLQRLVQPLAGEYGLHADEPLGKTHRTLFREWFESVMGGEEALDSLMKDSSCPAPKAEWLFNKMITDIETAGRSPAADKMEKASYALGYNLAVEYLANPEKTWLLESFEKFDEKILKPLGRKAEYEFLVVHAIGEKEHAHLGHEATALFVPMRLEGILRKAMRDHDRDLAAYYNHLASILEGRSIAKC